MIYQIFVDRFARANSCSAEVAAWGSVPTRTHFMGGDLPGIRSRLGYLEDLGINVLYLTPIFFASSNHRYNTYDYYRIDPRLGSLRDFRRLLREAHGRGMRVLLDGVFNHCGRGFYPFFDVMENGAHSAYLDWFHIESFPVEAYGRHRFKSWQGSPVMPILNLGNRETRDYLLRVAAFWTRQGIDGWRLDAVPHVKDREFWEHFRRAVRKVNPRAYLIAEIWEDADPWLRTGDFDGATNYRFREVVLEFLVTRSIGAAELARRLGGLFERHSRSTALAMLNLLGSHDTPRLRTLTGGDTARLCLAFLLLFCFPGIPAVYYGDEIGLEGGEDPDNRRAMEWDAERWDQPLRAYVKKLAGLRRSLAALKTGDWRTILAEDRRNVCAFLRRNGTACAMIVLNNGKRRATLEVDLRPWKLGEIELFVDRLDGRQYRVEDQILKIPRLAQASGVVLTPGRAG